MELSACAWCGGQAQKKPPAHGRAPLCDWRWPAKRLVAVGARSISKQPRDDSTLGGHLAWEFGHRHTAGPMCPAGAAGRRSAHLAPKLQRRPVGRSASAPPLFWLAGVNFLVDAFNRAGPTTPACWVWWWCVCGVCWCAEVAATCQCFRDSKSTALLGGAHGHQCHIFATNTGWMYILPEKKFQ